MSNVHEIIQELSAGKLAPLYIVSGEEDYLKRQFLKTLRERIAAGGFADWNWQVFAGGSTQTGDVLASLGQSAWGASERAVVVNQAENVPAEELASMVSFVEEQSLADATLVLLFAKVDKRAKFFKQAKKVGREVICEQLRRPEAERWVRDYCLLKGRKIRQDAIAEFVGRVGTNLSFLSVELEKLFLYAADRTEITAADVQAVTCFGPEQLEQGAVFQLTDALTAKDQRRTLAVLHRLVDAGESPFRILPLIERQLRLILAAKTRGEMTPQNVAEAMGENSDFPLKKVLPLVGNYSLEELYRAFYLVIRADSAMKLGQNGELVLEQLIAEICAQ